MQLFLHTMYSICDVGETVFFYTCVICLLLKIIVYLFSPAATSDGQQRGAPRWHGHGRLEEFLRELLQWRPRRVRFVMCVVRVV